MPRTPAPSAPDAAAAVPSPSSPAPAGIQSLELGLELFELLMAQGHALGVSELARLAGMHRAKVYRYLVSLVRAGWVHQDADSGLYQAGPALRHLALAWLARQDWLELASSEARGLAQTQGNTCLVAVQTEAGVCALRVYQPGQGVSVGVAPGALFDLRTSATGRVFAAWAEPAGDALTTAQRARIRGQGVAVVEGEHAPGINALGAPVFDAHGHLLLALTLVGHGAALRADATGTAALALRAACARVSGALGWQPPQR
uniref:Helix-turn-helix domain-containing protein n=1 Tax=Comamonas flocculans TaxID=2597701 RepID=A0A5B8RWI0_9BURK|nr:helix-turn-helix domain-containing protein [Comamonas flocculans]QEA13911.1 helix-turn-helix domain-containing protein [Comamonas flocculans]